MKKYLLIIAALSVSVLCLASCGKKADDTAATEPTSATEDEAEDGQNSLMNFVGPYASDRASIMVEAGEGSDGTITVSWANSATETVEWTMSGTFDMDSRTLEYADCVKKVVSYNEDGEVDSENVIYENGKGSFTFADDGPSLTWNDEEENIADGMTFEWNAN